MKSKLLRYAIVVLVLTSLAALSLPAFAADIITPSADTFVRDGDHAENNYGDAKTLEVKWESDRAGFTRTSFMTFDIGRYEAVESATLRLFVDFSDELDSRLLQVFDVTGATWTESDLTWENAPLTGGTLVAQYEALNISHIWIEIDLTEAVKAQIDAGSDELSIRLETASDHWGGFIAFHSKEADTNRPELSVVGTTK